MLTEEWVLKDSILKAAASKGFLVSTDLKPDSCPRISWSYHTVNWTRSLCSNGKKLDL